MRGDLAADFGLVRLAGMVGDQSWILLDLRQLLAAGHTGGAGWDVVAHAVHSPWRPNCPETPSCESNRAIAAGSEKSAGTQRKSDFSTDSGRDGDD